MTWNYRIIKHGSAKHAYFAIHEVFYDDKGKVINWTERPIDIIGKSKASIEHTLKQMTLDIERPVLSEIDLLRKIK